MNLRTPCLSLLALGAALAANATVFEYSYAINDGHGYTALISGGFTGNIDGNFVKDLSDVTVFINGHQIGGTIYTAGYDYSYGASFPAMVSFDVSQNNFLFINSNVQANDWDSTGFFSITAGDYFGNQAVAYLQTPFQNVYESPLVQSHWKLTALSTPDSGPTLLMFGAALTGLAWFRRRQG